MKNVPIKLEKIRQILSYYFNLIFFKPTISIIFDTLEFLFYENLFKIEFFLYFVANKCLSLVYAVYNLLMDLKRKEC